MPNTPSKKRTVLTYAAELERLARDLRREEVRRMVEDEKLSFTKIAQRLGVTRQRVGQLYNTPRGDAA